MLLAPLDRKEAELRWVNVETFLLHLTGSRFTAPALSLAVSEDAGYNARDVDN